MFSRNNIDHCQWLICQNMEVKKVVLRPCEPGRSEYLMSSLGKWGNKTTPTRLYTASACVHYVILSMSPLWISHVNPDLCPTSLERNLGLT